MSDRPRTSDGLPEDPDLAGEQDETNSTVPPRPPSTGTEPDTADPGPHQEQGGMRS